MAFYYVFPVLILFLYRPSGPWGRDQPWLGVAAVLGVQLVLVGWLRIQALREAERFADVPRPGVADDRPERLRRIQRHQTATLFVFLAAWFGLIHVLHLPDLVWSHRYGIGASIADVVLLLPFYGLVLLLRWAGYPAVRALRGIDAPPREYLGFHLRAMAIFALPPLLYVLLFRWLLLHAGWFRAILSDHPGWLLAAAALLILLLLAGSPVLVRHLFPRVPLDTFLQAAAWSEEDRTRLHRRIGALGRSAGARLGPILVWRTGGMRIANAAVAGLISRYQRVFVSDALLALLGEDELMAVLAHELGHVRMRHPLLNYLLALSAIALVTLALAALGPTIEETDGERGLLLPLAILGLNAAYLVTVLRLALNRFERQADALAAEAMDGEGPFVSALMRLVALNVASPRQGSITHPSAHRRVAALRALGDGDHRRAWLARERWLNRALIALAALVLAAAALVLERM